MKGFVSHIMRLSGKSKIGSQEAKNKKRNRKAGLKNRKQKTTGLGFYSDYGMGLQSRPELGRFELATDAKATSTLAFL